jgi:4-amino-4-deoxy-L-arabinose transferase-like glycosyltransferase
MSYNPLPMVNWSGIHGRWLIVTAVLLFFYLALNSLVGDSPTMDEQNHIGRGLAFVHSGDPRLSLEHPPLVNALSAVPLLTLSLDIPFDHPSWTEKQPADVYWYVFGEELMWQRGNDVTQMIFLARLPIVVMLLGLALVGFHFARQLWGRRAGFVAFLLLLFDPNLLAHGRYTTTDLGGTFFMFLATYLLWRLWSRPRDEKLRPYWHWHLWLWAALGMGLAFGSKLSILTFVPIWLLLALLPQPEVDWQWRAALRRVAQLLTAGLLSIGVVWLIFGLEWGTFFFSSEWLLFLNEWRGPMPTFWAGIEKILLLSGGGRASFLMGEMSSEGFLLYFPVAFLVKTPLPTLLLLGLGTAVLLSQPHQRRRALWLLLPILAYFAFSLTSALNIGYRHLFPMLPFIYLLISGLANYELRITNYELRLGNGVLLVGGVWLLLNTLTIHPHYLSFFNALGGGPAQGYNILIDSNVDWGQDLLRLQAWLAENGEPEVKLGWFGTADPAYYGIAHQPLPGFPRQPYYGLWTEPPFNPAQPEAGLYAISVSSLWESDLPEKNVYPYFRQREPDDRVGYSILIYDLR